MEIGFVDHGRRVMARAPRVSLLVTQELARIAEHHNSGHCMVADAVKLAVPGAKSVAVDLQTIRFTDPIKGLRYVYLTPHVLQQALVDFDQGVILDHEISSQLRDGSVTKSGRGAIDRPDMPEGRKRRLVRPEKGSDTSVPVVVGGRTPPLAALSNSKRVGQRREFGMRRAKP